MDREIVVQKFGGSSLATEAGRLAAVKHVSKASADGYAVVVVVSAMGRSGDPYATDTLLSVLGDPGHASAHDLDILMSCGEAISAVTFATLLRRHGHNVTVLNGQQAGIRTDFEHGDARILDINPHRINMALAQSHVVVVMGFQGATVDGDVTTLGRGGSDTSATALAAALGAKVVDIFTDVDGVMTADPRMVDEASCIRYASYTEICHLAHHGAKVIHPTAVEMAMAGGVPIRVRNTLSDNPGTLIGEIQPADEVSGCAAEAARKVWPARQAGGVHNEWSPGGVTSTKETWYVKFDDVGVAQSASREIGGLLGHTGYVDCVDGQMAITPASHHRQQLAQLLHSLEHKAKRVQVCSKVAVIGSGEERHLQHSLQRAHDVLQAEGIAVVFSGVSSHAIWCLVPQDCSRTAVNILHREFGIGEMERQVVIV